jgi:glycosyltransferase involved in cell wall biosynthesis
MGRLRGFPPRSLSKRRTESPLRVLILAQFYPPIVGGEERLVQDLGADLLRRGNDVAVATLWHEGLPASQLDGRVRVHRLRGSTQRLRSLFQEAERPHAPPAPDPELVVGLGRVVSNEQPDVVHAHNWIVHSFWPLKRWSGAKLVMTLHDYSLVCAKKRFFHRGAPCTGPGFTKCLACAGRYYGFGKGVPITLLNWAMSAPQRGAVDMFLPVSHAVAAGTGLVGSALPYRVIPNFVPDDVVQRADASDVRVGELPEESYILFVGDVVRDKGIDVLLRAYGELESPPPLVLIGRSDPTVPTPSGPNIKTFEPWPHAALIEAWRRCAIAVVPSLLPEAFGLVALEAMAMGRPVVASRVGGLPEVVIDGETGILTPPGDASALKDALHLLLREPELRQRMGRAARERARYFTASSVVPQIEHAYHDVLSTPVPGSGIRATRTAS